MRPRARHVIWGCIGFVLLVVAGILGWHHWAAPPPPPGTAPRADIAVGPEGGDSSLHRSTPDR